MNQFLLLWTNKYMYIYLSPFKIISDQNLCILEYFPYSIFFKQKNFHYMSEKFFNHYVVSGEPKALL